MEGGRGWVVVLGVVLVELVLLAVRASRHGVNADEGFYLAAGRYILEGRQLYGDVFFPQMPYLPRVEATLFGLFGVSLGVARALCVVAGAATAGLIVALAWAQTRSVAVSGAVGLLYIASGVLLNNLAITKTYALANLCLLTAFALLTSATMRHPVWAFAAGIALGTAVGVRLAVAPVALVFAFLAWRRGWPALLAFGGGALLASLPWLRLAWSYPDQFWFCNVTFHSLRREIGGAAVLWQRLEVIAKWLLVPQHVFLWALAALGLLQGPRQVWPAAACAAVLAAAYAMATPTYLEYTAQFLPFVLLTAVPGVVLLLRRPALAAGLLAAYVVMVYPFVRDVPATSALAAKRALWDLDTVTAVNSFLRDGTPRQEPILSWWEGYPVLSDRPGFVGVGFWESNVAKKLTPAEARRYHVLQRDDIRDLIQRRAPSAVIVADGMWQSLRADITTAGYLPSRRVGAVQIYLRDAPQADTTGG